MTNNQKLIQKLDLIEPLVDSLNDEELNVQYRFLCDRIANPDFYAVMLGETSSGKSSIINGLLGATVLPVDARPTTGVVTEVDINCTDEKMYAIDKKACIEEISAEKFSQLALNPGNDLNRLVVHKSVQNNVLKGIRMFDTPGYGSIVKEHEEILKDFLPNADIVVYVINYTVGIMDNDFYFLRSIKELLREETEIVVVVNMCPENLTRTDRRIAEIRKTIGNLVNGEPRIFCSTRIRLDRNSTEHALPKCDDLWKCIAETLNSPKRQQIQYEMFDSFISEFFEKCSAEANDRYNAASLDDESREIFAKEQEEYAKRLENAIPTLIEPTFVRIIDNLPQKLDAVKDTAYEIIDDEIERKPRTANQQEMIAFTNMHLLPHNVEHQAKEIVNFYVETEIEKLNRQVEDYINNETIEFKHKVELNINVNFQKAVSALVENISKKFIESGFRNYFSAFGGAAGAGGGIANAASHGLKVIGKWFGHTFSRSTHNAVKHALSKIGFTSTKVLGAAAAVLVEALIVVWDFATWKSSLRSKVKDALKDWRNDALEPIKEDMKKLEDENISTMRKIVSMARENIHYPDYKSSELLYKDVALADNIRIELTKIA